MFQQQAAMRYQQVQASTATPGELLLALYDGLFRFLRGAQLCFQNHQNAKGRELLSKSHAIVSELLLALDHGKAPELCARLEAIYDFCMGQMVLATANADAKLVGDVIRVLTPLQEAWQIAVPEARREASAGIDPPRTTGVYKRAG
jgi:flagellar secretion chaperone FliS